MENDCILPDMVDPVEEESYVDLENLPAHFLAVDGDPLAYKTVIGNKVINSPAPQQQPSPAVAPHTNSRKQAAPAARNKRKTKPTRSRKRRKSSEANSQNQENKTFVYPSMETNR